MTGYILVRGGVHQVAYAKALETLTGCEVTRMLNIPKISNESIPEAKKFNERGVHRTLYRFSQDDYRDIDKIWHGQHPEDGNELVIQDGPPEGGRINPLPEEPQVFAPGYHPGELVEIAQRMMQGV